MTDSTPSCVPTAVIPLWDKNTPVPPGGGPADQSSIEVYVPASGVRTKTAVILFPGGGYGYISDLKEGTMCAEWLNARGITAVILRYRVVPHAMHPQPLEDAKRGIRIVRSRASEWGIDPDLIGVWGFSAGGHLAALAGTSYDSGNPDAADPVERVSSRPSFMILSYPVITMDESLTHMGSRIAIMGESPSEETIDELSVEKHVTADTPPTFLFHTDEDTSVPAENSIAFYMALRKAHVPAELHIFQPGIHGVALAGEYPLLCGWPEIMHAWMKGQGFLP